jgi:molecular chaperone DnaK
MYLGIDLGTSNSAIIGYDAGRLRLFKTAEGMDVLPSAIMIDRRGAMFVGKRAYDHPIVKKGTPLPSSGKEMFRAARDLRTTDGTYLDFELFEQTEDVDDPALNLAIGAFRISSTDLERGDVIRKGDQVFVHWSIDGNGLLNCELEVPEISKTFSTHRAYVSTRDHKNFDGDDGTRFATEAIQAADEDIRRLDKALGSRVGREISELQDRLARQQDTLRLAHEADTRRTVSEEGRRIRQEVARIRNNPQNIRASLRAEIDEFVEAFSLYLSKTADPKVNSQVHRLAGLARDALVKEDLNGIEDARRSLDEMRAIVLSDFAKQPTFWVGMFDDMANDRHRAIDKAKHDRLVREGQSCIKAEDVDGLRQINFQMRDNMLRGADGSSADILAGLMR